jgi:hypothetical protein
LPQAIEAAPIVLDYLRGSGTLASAAHAAYTVIGYGLSVALPDTTQGVAASHVTACTGPELEAHLRTLAGTSPGGMAAPALPWGAIALTLLRLAETWLAG